MARLKKPLKGPTLLAEKELTDPQPVIESHEKPLEDEAPLEEATVERVPLGRLLVDAGFLTRAQLDECLFEGSKTGERIGEVVVRRNLATEDDIARLLAEQWGLDYVERSAIWFDGNALAKLSKEDAQRWEALPTRVEGGRVVVAVAEPTEQRIAAVREPDRRGDGADRRAEVCARRRSAQSAAREPRRPVRGEFATGRARRPGPRAANPCRPAGRRSRARGRRAVFRLRPGSRPSRRCPTSSPIPSPSLRRPSGTAKSNPNVTLDLELSWAADDAEADAVQALAAEAQAVAERLAAQAARRPCPRPRAARAARPDRNVRGADRHARAGARTRRFLVETLRNHLRTTLDSLPE